MRKHRKYEKVSKVCQTIQTFNMSNRELINLIQNDVEVEVKAKKGLYGNGSFENRIPRTMDISRLARMSSRPPKVESPAPVVEQPTPPVEPTPAE